MNSVYIAGPISGKPDFKQTFSAAEAELTAKGWIVLNPASLPAGLSESQYMDICLAMVRQADVMMMLPDWENSMGACCERLLAKKMNKPICYSVRDAGVVAL